MKTLDIVIEAIENCEIKKQNCFTCPYRNDDGNCYALDALYYLKEYRDAKNALDVERRKNIEAYCQWKDAKEKLEAQTSHTMWVDKHFQFEISDNPPLTWDELKAMTDKPVWVEVDGKWWGRFWAFVEVGNDSYINFFEKGQEYPEDLWKCNMGKEWNAYRKERK